MGIMKRPYQFFKKPSHLVRKFGCIPLFGHVFFLEGRFRPVHGILNKIIEKGDSEDYRATINSPWMPSRYAYVLWNLGHIDRAKEFFDVEIERDLKYWRRGR